ncbi:MAG: sugar ABC transporter permease [Anaerolineales bacterium]|nr:sugar ABC transporter permease [Anaerolineales bacterium]
MRRINFDRIMAFLFILPSILAILVFVYGFIGWTAWASLLKWDNIALIPKGSLFPDVAFTKFDNYVRLLTSDQRFQIDLRNTVIFTITFIVGCLSLGLILAVLLDQKVKGEGIFRSIFLFPMAVSFIVTGVVWRWVLNPGNETSGAVGVNQLFENIGLPFLKSAWYTNPKILYIQPASSLGTFLSDIGLGFLSSPNFGISLAILSVVLAATWQMSGYTMALYLAGLRGIPEELREAARVDGASELQIYRSIILPLLQPITLSAVIILGHISLKIFDLVSAMTGPGPAFATDVPAYYMFDTVFRGNHFARGAAIAIILLLSVAVLVVPYLSYSMKTEVQQ